MKSDKPCPRIRLNFHAMPESLYNELLDEFRRQFATYDRSENGWHWDIVASDAEHPDAGAIFQMCFTLDEEDLEDENDLDAGLD